MSNDFHNKMIIFSIISLSKYSPFKQVSIISKNISYLTKSGVSAVFSNLNFNSNFTAATRTSSMASLAAMQLLFPDPNERNADCCIEVLFSGENLTNYYLIYIKHVCRKQACIHLVTNALSQRILAC